MNAAKGSLTWRSKLLLLLLCLSVGPLLVVTAVNYEHVEETHVAATLENLSALAAAKAQAMDQFAEDRRRDVERIASLVAPRVGRLQEAEARSKVAPPPTPEENAALPALKDAEAMPTHAPPSAPPSPVVVEAPPPEARPEPPKGSALEDARAELMKTIGLILWDQHKFEELLIIDPTGRVLASTFDKHEDKSAAELAYFQQGLGATFLQPVFVSPITNQLTMVISTPIRDENHRAIGVLAARLNLSRFFQLVNDTTGLGRTGETVITKRVDQKIQFMVPTRHEGEAALKREVAVGAREAVASQEASRGQRGSGRVLDYRGRCSFSAWQPLSTTDWGLVTKMDCEEVLQPVVTASKRLALIVALVALACVIASVVTARMLLQPLEKLKAATDRISRGDFDVQLDIQSQDEIGQLADSFERMVAAIKFFREQSQQVPVAPKPPGEPAVDDVAMKA